NDHPEHPELVYVLALLGMDCRGTPGCAPDRATDLLEKLAAPTAFANGEQGLYVVEQYCLPYPLPIASCKAFLARSRKALEADRRLEKGDEVWSFGGRSAAAVECQLPLAGGRGRL